MPRYFIEFAFDGTNYHGWQVQPNAVTVQETLEHALSTLLKEKINVVGAGRTDTGVHASNFVAHFDYSGGGREASRPLLQDIQDFIFKLNRFLPDDIVFFNIRQVENDMHARYSAKYRTYRYIIKSEKPLLDRQYCYYYFGKLNVSMMNISCSILKEYTDFTSFSKLHTDVKTNECKIMEARWQETGDGYEFTIKADRFLRNMVRSIVGTMLEIGTGKLDLDGFRKIIEAKDRGRAGTSAEAKGLFLVDIGFDG